MSRVHSCEGSRAFATFGAVRNTITVRIPSELAQWLDEKARKTGVPKGRIIREELEKAMKSESQPFMRLAGAIAGPANLSARKGFSRKWKRSPIRQT